MLHYFLLSSTVTQSEYTYIYMLFIRLSPASFRLYPVRVILSSLSCFATSTCACRNAVGVPEGPVVYPLQVRPLGQG